MLFFSGSLTSDLLAILIGIIVCLISYYKLAFTYWKKRGVIVPYKPHFPFGNFVKLFLAKESFGKAFQRFYEKLRQEKHPYGGIYLLAKPVFVVADLELVKSIMQTDFQYFVNHGIVADEKIDPLMAHLFNMEDDVWKDWRIRLTPTFTTGKMKMMLQTVINTTEGLKDLLETYAKSKSPLDIKEAIARFTTDIIGSVAFGIECNSLKNPNSTFRQYGRKAVEEQSWIQNFKVFLLFCLPPGVVRFLHIKVTEDDVEKFFINAVKATVEYREQNDVFRKDFMHLLLQLRNRGKVTDDEKITDEGERSEPQLTIEEVAAQCFLFFIAGFETSSTVSTFALYELAKHKDIQTKLRNEIMTVLQKHDNKMTYEALGEMHYLEQTIQESLRKYPPIPSLFRVCSKDYQVPGSSLVIEKGTQVHIPILGIQMDTEYFPDPEKFDPDRFSEENKKTRPAFAWLPFGEGPRMCLGLRFGMMQSKVGIATVIANNELSLNAKTNEPLKYKHKGVITTAEGGIWLDVKKLRLEYETC